MSARDEARKWRTKSTRQKIAYRQLQIAYNETRHHYTDLLHRHHIRSQQMQELQKAYWKTWDYRFRVWRQYLPFRLRRWMKNLWDKEV